MKKTTRVALLAAVSAVALALAGFAGSAAAKDRNHDKLPDKWEKRHKLSLKVNQAGKDQDRDGLRNRGEFRSHTDPRDTDSDDDGVEDSDEDRDSDKVDNGNEQAEGTKQNDKDSDDDGTKDGREDADDDDLNNSGEDQTGNDPVDPDTDDDSIEDGDENAGTIASFDGTTLVIDLAGGAGKISGLVDETTEIKCESEDEHEHGDESGDDDSSSDDGPGDDEGEDDSEGDSASIAHEGEGKGDSNEMDDSEHGDDDNVCSVADLVPGTSVHEAELEGDTFEEVELVK